MSTAAAMRHEHEPEPDLRNGMLEMFERAIELCKEQGLEPQMRTILNRTMPVPPAATTADVNFAISMGTVLSALKSVNPRNYSEGQRQTLSHAKQIVLREMSRALAKEAA